MLSSIPRDIVQLKAWQLLLKPTRSHCLAMLLESLPRLFQDLEYALGRG